MPRITRSHWTVALLIFTAMAPAVAEDGVAQSASAVDSPIETSQYSADQTLSLDQLPAADAAVSATRIEELEARINELEFTLADMQSRPASSSGQASSADSKKMPGAWGENGFTATSPNGAFKVHIGGRVQLDAVALSAPDLTLGGEGAEDSVNFRRARFRIAGTMYETMDWATEFDFVNSVDSDPTAGPSPVNAFGGDVIGTVAPTDLWVTFREVPWAGNIRIGNQKEPIGLEHVESSRFLDFMERSYLQDAFFGPFNNGFSPGVTVFDWNESETVTWAVGGYKNTQNVFAYDVSDNAYALTGRLTCVPWSACEDRRLLHLGVASSYRGLDQDADLTTGNIRVRSRASLRNGPGPLNPTIADTNFAGRLFAESETLIAPEAAMILGPWTVQTEYVSGFLNSTTFTPIAGVPTDVDQVHFQGSYIHVLYFLTGEHRAFDRREARFGRVVPYENLSMLPNRGGFSGLGAWQIGARYGFLDLNDDAVQGGNIQDLTIGLNWFLNPHSKFQFNYIVQHVDNTLRNSAGVITAENDADLTGFGVRFAHDF